MPIAITTPTGHIGRRLTERLLDAGADLVLLLRDATRLDAAVRDRVETREGALQDAAYVTAATADADALFWLSPPNPARPDVFGWYDDLGASARRAVEANGIAHVVNLSSQGAHRAEGHGPVSGLHRVEQALNATGAHVRHLRPGFFMENFEEQLGPIREAGAVFFPAPPDTRVAMVATRDIADVAADLLLDRSWTGQAVRGVHGSRDLTYAEAARILGDVLGREVRAQQVPPEAVTAQLEDVGMHPSWARELTTLYVAIGGVDSPYSAEARTPETTTPTTLRQFAERHLAPKFEVGSAT